MYKILYKHIDFPNNALRKVLFFPILPLGKTEAGTHLVRLAQGHHS